MSGLIPNSLKDIQIKYAQTASKLVDDLTEMAPILRNYTPFEASTHAYWNVYEELIEASGPAFIQFNEPDGGMSAPTELKKLDLGKIAGTYEVGEDTANGYGGPGPYFAKKFPIFRKRAGEKLEYAILYDSLRKYCEDNHTAARPLLIDAGGTGNTNYSMIFVRWEEGVCTGLYSPVGFKVNAGLQEMMIHGGSLYPSQGLYGVAAGTMVYGMRMLGYFGMQMASIRNVFAIVNINATSLPTEDNMNFAITQIRAEDSPRSMILCHPTLKGYMQNVFKSDSYMRVKVKDMALGQEFESWNGLPFITSYNFLNGTETDVVVA